MGSRSLENRLLVDEIEAPMTEASCTILAIFIAFLIASSGFIGALQSVSREAYFTVAGSLDSHSGASPELSSMRKQRFPGLKGETNKESLEAMVKSVGLESLQWGCAAGVYSGLTYGLKEARGAHDWKNSAIAGALAGVAVALVSGKSSHEHIVEYAITGAALSAAGNNFASRF